MPRGKRQSKDYGFINLKAHYLKVSVIPRYQTMPPRGVDGTSAKCQKCQPSAAAIAGEASSM